LRATHLGLKEKKRLESSGKNPSPAVLDDILSDITEFPVVALPVREIPADRIVGTKSKGRSDVFSASFMPLADSNSEFAQKWMALCAAHLSDEGIRDPIECYEYLGDFYVQEGNKRTSVMKYFGAPRIPARVKRIMPTDKTDPKVAAYYEFLDFYAATGLYDVQFKKVGEYAELYSALDKPESGKWTEDEVNKFEKCFCFFKQAFNEINGKESGLSPEEALLTFFKVYAYDQLCKMSQAELKKALAALWQDVKALSEPDEITVKTEPDRETKKGVIGKLITGATRHLNVAFIYQKDEKSSPWTSGHSEGAAHLASALGDAVTVKNYFYADSREKTVALLEKAVLEGADVVFATTPPMLRSTLKVAVVSPKVRFFNCSASQPVSSVRSYYCRTYEGKFVTGAIAGALAANDIVGYIASYPIYGVPASINAFALGVKMTNPRAKILLEWNCVKGDHVKSLLRKGARVISDRDVPLPDANYMSRGRYGTFVADGKGKFEPIASPCWMWGAFYEKITRLILSGSLEKKDQSEAVNYWWGMDSGAIDVTLSDLIPDGVRRLAEMLIKDLKAGTLDPFSQRLIAFDGTVITDGVNKPTSMQILHMDKLADTVIGGFPEYEELAAAAKTLVKEIGTRVGAATTETEKKL